MDRRTTFADIEDASRRRATKREAFLAAMDEANGLAEEILGRVNAVLEAKGVMMRGGSIVDATFIEAPSSTKNASGSRDPGYTGVAKRPEVAGDPALSGVEWVVAEKPSRIKGMRGLAWEHSIEGRKASVRSKVEHPFLVVKRQFGCARCRYRGLAKNASMLTVLFALANVTMWSRAGCPELPACSPA